MSPSEAAVAARACLELLVEGSAARETAIFRDLGRVPGIHLRKPAVGGGPPAFERGELSEDHGVLFSAGEGREISAEHGCMPAVLRDYGNLWRKAHRNLHGGDELPGRSLPRAAFLDARAIGNTPRPASSFAEGHRPVRSRVVVVDSRSARR